LSLTLAGAMALALLVDQAQWLLDNGRDSRGVEAARRLAATGVDALARIGPDSGASRALALETDGG
ncbi:MAG TPA: acyl-CoA dehydrogenase, partial [Myxococcota bacterium]|nr:acyl-CoA dehydrogenase [Myxococcota bacterium]